MTIDQYAEHDPECLAGQYRAGRPTKDGSYEQLYGYSSDERWWPRGQEPPCSCGLKEALDTYAAILNSLRRT